MAMCVTRQGWRRLLSLMEAKLPDSVEVYGLLRTSLSGDWPFYNFWVDQWPDVTAVVASPKYRLLDDFSGKFNILHGQDVTVVTEMLKHPGIIQWSHDLTFDLPPHLMPALTAAAQTNRGQLSVITKCVVYTATKKTLKKPNPLGDGLIVERLTPQDAGFVAKKWGLKDPGVEKFIEQLISTSLPNVCVRTSSDRKIRALTLTQPNNMLGMGYVEPAFRGQKLCTLVQHHIVEQLIVTSPIAAWLIEPDNIAAQKASTSTGSEMSNVKLFTVGFRHSVMR